LLVNANRQTGETDRLDRRLATETADLLNRNTTSRGHYLGRRRAAHPALATAHAKTAIGFGAVQFRRVLFSHGPSKLAGRDPFAAAQNNLVGQTSGQTRWEWECNVNKLPKQIDFVSFFLIILESG
jgi:hypothetical protein